MCDDCGEHESKVLHLERQVLSKNSQLAEQNRLWFKKHSMRAINMMSSPGSGKTTLLEKTTQAFCSFGKMAILVGDLQTELDAERLRTVGARALQINTGQGCHLDAAMIAGHLGKFIAGDERLLMIENVGNLVCPSAYDLGEQHKVALLSVTEGEDKPLKYPALFHQADLIVITKMDLVAFVPWSQAKAMDAILKVNPRAKIIRLSAHSGEGMDEWLQWLKES
ncbi:MAG: hydrogenase accessory protein HypB [Bdellovibrionales bacterium GWA2_49_15]|nr:MAG: hydrogenase accessory protein HypB [Bdellovibrionales bacterium GWA2_49_15]HAZ14209.1 hydrogenase accessory protein HypB [Bdellovibrionales bacterium]